MSHRADRKRQEQQQERMGDQAEVALASTYDNPIANTINAMHRSANETPEAASRRHTQEQLAEAERISAANRAKRSPTR